MTPRNFLRGQIALLVLATTTLGSSLLAQSGQTQNQLRKTSASPAAVSRDLLAVYEKTKTAKTEPEVTAIARACSKVVPDTQRSRVDRKYASSLLAWALNRRGEIRNEMAAKLVGQGQLKSAQKLDQLAADDYATAIQYGPPSWRTHHNLAIALAMQGEYTQAIAQFDEAIDLNPDYANAFFNRGELFFELGKFERAIEDYDLAIAQDSKDPQYFNSRGHANFMLEQYDSAVADYTAAASKSQDDAMFQADLADAHQFLGNWQKSAEAYRAAVAIDSKFARAYQNAAWLMATCPDAKYRKTELAITSAKRALAIEGKRTARLLDTLAAAYAASGKYKDAVRTEAEALKLAEEETRAEFASRQQLYQQGVAYLQPKNGTLAHAGSASPVRTAASSSGSPR